MNPSREATSYYFLRLQKKLTVTATTSAVITILFALIVLTGHIINSLPLIRFPNSNTGMNPMIAVSFLLAGTAVLLFVNAPSHNTVRIFCRIVAVILIIEGICRFAGFIGLFDLKLDILLFRSRFVETPAGVISGRMSYTSSFLFILTGIGILIRLSDRRRILQYVLLVVIGFSIFNFISIIYGVSNVYFGPSLVLKMSLSTSICFFMVAFALLLTDYKQGLIAIITSPKTGGKIARSFLPIILFFPLLLAVIELLNQRYDLFEQSFGLALFSVICMIVFFILIIRTARSNNDTHDELLKETKEREKAVEQASSSDLFASVIFDNIPNMVFVKEGRDLRFKTINRAGEEMMGTTREELLGKNDYELFPKEEADLFRAKDEEAFITQEPVIIEEPMTTKKNGVRWVRTKKISVRDEKGRPLYMVGIVEDITELKEKQEQLNRYNIELEEKVKERTAELLKSEKRFHAIIQSAPDAMVIANHNEVIQLVNTQTERLFGYTRNELVGKPMDLLIPDRKKRFSSAGHELMGKTKNGKSFPVEISLSPIETSEGILISVSIRDITERKKAEKVLIENELMFRDLTQNVPGVIYQWMERFDGTTGFTYVSPKLKQYFLLETDEIEKIPGYIHPEDKERWTKSLEEAKVNETPWFYEGRLVYPDGTIKWLRCHSIMSLTNDEGRLYNGLMTDITDQKIIEEKIASNQKRFEAIFNSQYQFMGLLTTEGTMIEANETALNFAGLQLKDVIGKPFWDCYWWAISERMQVQLRQSVARAAKGEFIRYEADILGKGGIIATIDFSIKPVLDDFGKVILLIPEGRDITQRKLLEQRAREQEEQIRLFVKHTPAAIAMFDNQMRYMVASDRWYEDYRLIGTDIIGKSHYKIFPEIEDLPKWKAIHQRCLNGAIEINEQDAFVRANGTTDWLRYEIYPWRTSNNKIGGIIMFTEVITEKMKVQENLKKLNKKLTESNKELEQFAYVASHDLQEPLRMVSSFLQLLEKKYKTQLDETAHQYIHFAVDGSERMKNLINDLLKFSRVGTTAEENSEIDCNTLLKSVIKVFEQKIHDNDAIIKVETLPVIRANKTQVEQLFQNLIGNALKYRGKESPVIEIGAEEEGSGWKFHVKDNGIGIESKFYEKVFVIFQRLHGKNEYGGTGIGLAICKKIVERHGGKIWIESEAGKGSAFYFSFPKVETVALVIEKEQ